MFKKIQKQAAEWTIKLFNVRWYPSSRSCVKMSNRIVRPQMMPPLMVRKAAWRR
jgi:hypothetical protein